MADRVPPDESSQEALLRRFEPVIRFTKGEWFYPMDAEPYVRAASLWVRRPGEEAVCAVPAGELTLDRLAQQPEDSANAVHYLKIPPPQEDGRRVSLARLRARRSPGTTPRKGSSPTASSTSSPSTSRPSTSGPRWPRGPGAGSSRRRAKGA